MKIISNGKGMKINTNIKGKGIIYLLKIMKPPAGRAKR